MSSFYWLVLLVCICPQVSGQCSRKVFEADELEAMNQVKETETQLAQLVALHSNNHTKFLHNTEKSFLRMFRSSTGFMYGAYRFLLSRYDVNNFYTAGISCALFGGHLPEIFHMEMYRYLVKNLKGNGRITCIILGTTKRNDNLWRNSFPEDEAITEFINGQPTKRKGFTFVEMRRDQAFKMVERRSFTTYDCQLMCQIPK
ncbi:uncharacterized protein LOC129923005 [Biomphalaria glabrata]|uniref:Uncharacterized protein LOC129923005 n=1 Tax=Biomphalaria glabrata TaxID=6526 RepID=A0A9W2YXZ2_BIOGL|nr:uncharacterized protein LOC129923005 [Biomphalaria glabrata]